MKRHIAPGAKQVVLRLLALWTLLVWSMPASAFSCPSGQMIAGWGSMQQNFHAGQPAAHCGIGAIVRDVRSCFAGEVTPTPIYVITETVKGFAEPIVVNQALGLTRFTAFYTRRTNYLFPPYASSSVDVQSNIRAAPICRAGYYLVLPEADQESMSDLGKPCPCFNDPVNPANGNEYQAIEDIPASGPLGTLGFSRYYNSIDRQSSALGTAWRHSYSRHLKIESSNASHVTSSERHATIQITATNACTSGWAELKTLAGMPNATATYLAPSAAYAFGACRISHNGHIVRVLPINSTASGGGSGGAQRLAAVRDDGTTVRFETLGDGNYTAEPGITERLTPTLDGGYRLVAADDSIELYGPEGRLQSIADRAGNLVTLGYDSGRLDTVSDGLGRSLSLAYDSEGHLQGITAPDGGMHQYGYQSGDARIRSAQRPDGSQRQYLYDDPQWINGLSGILDELGVRAHTWTYDTRGRVTAEQRAGGVDAGSLVYNGDSSTTTTDVLGAVRTFMYQQIGGRKRSAAVQGEPCIGCGYDAVTLYDSQGHIGTRIDDRGKVTVYSHDSRGLETSRTEAHSTPLARTFTTLWHPQWRLPTQIAEPRRLLGYVYDSDGLACGAAGHACQFSLQETEDTSGAQGLSAAPVGSARSWNYTYNARGQLLSIDGPRNDVADLTQFVYYEQDSVNGDYRKGDLWTITNALGYTIEATHYDAMGRLLRAVDANGLVTELSYDLRGRLISQNAGGLLTLFGYLPTGPLAQVTLPDASLVTYSYDPAGRLIRTEDQDGNRIEYTLDLAGNRTKTEVFDPANALRRTQTRVYDQLGLLRSLQGGQGQITTYTYDANGNRISDTVDGSRVTTRQHDAFDRLLEVTDPAGGVTHYAYDALDQLTQVTDPRGLATQYSVNAFGEVTQLQSPDTGTSSATYDSAGNLKTRTDAKGQVVTYTYDALNRLTKAVYSGSGGPTINYSYDQGTYGKGRLTGLSQTGQSLAWVYDALGRVTSQTQVVGSRTLVTGYSYDAQGRLATQTLPSGKVVGYAWNLNRLTGITLDGNPVASNLQQEPFGGTNQWDFANGQQVQKSFDLSGRMTGHSLGGISYDTANRITSLNHGGLSHLGGSKTYGYDDLDRLTSYLGAGYSIGYSYDANGNRTQQTGTAGTINYTIGGSSNRLTSLSDGSSTQSFTYDANGSLTADGLRTYGYDRPGRLSSLNGSAATYVYNGLGQRVSKTVSGTGTVYAYDAAGHLVGEYVASTGAPIQETIWMGDTPIAVVKGSDTYYVHADHLNTPRQINDASGDPVWVWDTITFGSSSPDEDPLATGTSFTYNLRHPGQVLDMESGLFQNWHRDYHPALGRYVQSDPIGLAGGINTYAYVDADPLSFADPEGLTKVNWFDPKEVIQYSGAESMPDIRGVCSVFAHGSYAHITDASSGKKIRYGVPGFTTPKGLKDLKKKLLEAGCESTDTVVLHSCNTGRDGPEGEKSLAEQFSPIWGARVVAPDRSVWYTRRGAMREPYGHKNDDIHQPRDPNDQGQYRQFSQ